MKTHRITHSVLTLLSAFTLSACTWNTCPTAKGDIIEERLILEAIDRLTVEGDIRVVWRSGTPQEVVVKGPSDLMDKLHRKVDNGHWTIGLDGCYSTRTPLEVSITTPTLLAVGLRGSGMVKGMTPVSGDRLDVELQGSGDIELSVEVTTLTGTIEGSGDMMLTGKAERFDASVTGSGDLRAAGLEAREVNASLAGSGDIQVTCSGVLDAAITGSGDIRYGGSPAEVRERITGSGTLSARP